MKKSLNKRKCNVGFEESCGNVFEDLDLPHSDDLLLKSSVVWSISESLRRRKIKQTEAAEILNTTQPKMSRLLRGDFEGFSLEKLLGFLHDLGNNVTITVEPSSHPEPISFATSSPQ